MLGSPCVRQRARWDVPAAAEGLHRLDVVRARSMAQRPPAVLLATSAPEHELRPWSEDSADVCEVCGWKARRTQVVEEWASRMAGTTPLDGGYPSVVGWRFRGRWGTEPVATDYETLPEPRWLAGGHGTSPSLRWQASTGRDRRQPVRPT